ncbi:MAG: YCF48-related protein [Ignavibacterium sp.]|jgi:photosystem II stability/assembly factor-like uncharacterized protein|nr:YCF48-related protein [Ignavibacterium sp.]
MKALFGKLVLIMAILVLTSSISAQWKLVSVPYKTNFNSAVQLTDTKAFVVGDNGVMLATNNRGSTWYKFDVGTHSNLNSIKFIDDYTGFIAGDDGLILKTDSRWRSWDNVSVARNYYNRDISFLNEQNGIVVGYKYLVAPEAPLSYLSILVTHDGGLTWSDKSPMLTGKLNSVVTFGKDNAIAVGNFGLVAFTNDRGENWYFGRITTSDLNSVRVCPKNEIKVIVGDNGALFVSKDEDRYRWMDYSISKFFDITSICQKADNTFVMAGIKKSTLTDNIISRSVIIESQELNGTWREVFSTVDGPLNAVNFCRNISAIAVGDKGTIAVYHREIAQDTLLVVDSPAKIDIQNYPNPFNPSTIISFALPEQTNVELRIYDVLGKEVATLLNESKPAGSYEVEWNASDLPSGVYIYQLRTGTSVQMKKMMLLK